MNLNNNINDYMNENWRTKMGLAGIHDMVSLMTQTCFVKCTQYRVHHNENALGSGEGLCFDRCLLKYNQASIIVGTTIKKHQIKSDTYNVVP